MTPNAGSVLFRLSVFFAVNPDECMWTSDIAKKFGADPSNVHNSLRAAVRTKWLLVSKERGQNVYRAGPELLKLLA